MDIGKFRKLVIVFALLAGFGAVVAAQSSMDFSVPGEVVKMQAINSAHDHGHVALHRHHALSDNDKDDSYTIYTCPMHPEVESDKPGKCPECGMNLVKKKKAEDKKKEKGEDKDKVIYTCPMHPEVESDKPGKCPECGMNLEKKERDSEDK